MRIIVDENNVITAILYAAHIDGSIEINGDVPAGVEPLKWCYTPEKGFYENHDYEPPEPEPEDTITQDDYNMDFDFRLSCLELGL